MKSVSGRLGAIALLAMLVRAVVPAGYMLAEAETSQGRYLTVEMCDGHTHALQVIDLDTGKKVDAKVLKAKHGKSEPKPPPCVCAGIAPLAPPLVAAVPVKFKVAYSAVFDLSRDVRPGHGIAAPPPPATGPPDSI